MVRISSESAPLILGEGRVDVLAPFTGDPESGEVNDDSLVLRLVWRDLSILFTGDMGIATEEALLASPWRLKADILKVGHHGSRFASSEAFLRSVAPRLGLIAAGYENTFHLPAQQTLERLAARRIPIYRTDLDGTVLLHSAGRGFSVTTIPP